MLKILFLKNNFARLVQRLVHSGEENRLHKVFSDPHVRVHIHIVHTYTNNNKNNNTFILFGI